MNEDQLIGLFGILILLAFVLRIYLPRIKGKIGEVKISLLLKFLNSKKYKTLNNILISDKSRSSQIDHVVVSIYGVFVIETKNYKGWIFGHENSKNWTQVLYKNKYQLRNPILQNWGHIKTLKRNLSEFQHVKYYPIVVFTGSAKLKKITSKVPVIKSYKLLRFISKNSKIECLSLEEVGQIYFKLNQLNKTDRTSRKSHVRNAKDIRRINVKNRTCPQCGEILLLKKGKFGKFYGCSNYPNCRYTKKFKME